MADAISFLRFLICLIDHAAEQCICHCLTHVKGMANAISCLRCPIGLIKRATEECICHCLNYVSKTGSIYLADRIYAEKNMCRKECVPNALLSIYAARGYFEPACEAPLLFNIYFGKCVHTERQ